MIRIRKSENYKYVGLYRCKDKTEKWSMEVVKNNTFYFDTERAAARAVDLYLIGKGKIQ